MMIKDRPHSSPQEANRVDSLVDDILQRLSRCHVASCYHEDGDSDAKNFLQAATESSGLVFIIGTVLLVKQENRVLMII